MAVMVTTANGQALLTSVFAAIDGNKIRTWKYEEHFGSKFLTHCVDQWNRVAWFKGNITAPGLVLSIVAPKDKHISTEVYAIYHGRFIEMLLSHFNSHITSASATGMPSSVDSV